MKQTIRTKNYNAVIQIPYEKLAKKSNCIKFNNHQQDQQTFSKTLVIPQCHACCQQKNTSTEQTVSMEMLEDLERAFEEDMRQKDREISDVKGQLRILQKQLSDNKNQLQKWKTNAQNQKQKYISIVNSNEAQINRLKKQMETIQNEKDNLLKTKIMEFRNNQLAAQRDQLTKMENLKLQFERRKQEEIDSLSLGHQNQKSKLRQEITELRLSSEYTRATLEKENQALSRQIAELNSRVSSLERQLQQSQFRERELSGVVNEKNSTISQYQKQNDSLRNQAIENTRQVNENLNLISSLRDRLASSENSYNELNIKYRNLSEDSRILTTKHGQSQSKVVQIQKIKSTLLSQIQTLEESLRKKQEQLKLTQNPKVYEVKIQKVIDRQDYIRVLETQLEAQRRINLTLSDRIKKLEVTLELNEKQFQGNLLKIAELEKTTLSLKYYIEEKEKSFAWIVEREIAKDIELNRAEINKTYKVYPMESKIYTQLKQQIPAEARIGFNQRIIIEGNEDVSLIRKLQQEHIINQASQIKQENKQAEV